jgi:hypothetical protein
VTALEFSIHPATRLVRITYLGDPTFDEFTATVRAIFAHPDFTPGMSVLADRSAITTPPTTEYVQRVVRFMGEFIPRRQLARWAQVASGPASFGVARMGGALGAEDQVDYRVFSDVARAERWLAGEDEFGDPSAA